MSTQPQMTIRTKGYVLLDGYSYPPDTVLQVPFERGLQMIGDQIAEELPEGGESNMPRNPGGGTGQHPPQAPVTAENYKPVFLTNVTTTSMNGVVTPVNPVYCLTKESAEQLAEILQDLQPKIVMAYPSKMMLVTASALVPWFQFPSGCAVNAGVEANWWSNASGATAEKNCRADISAACQQFQEEGGGQYPEQLQQPYGS